MKGTIYYTILDAEKNLNKYHHIAGQMLLKAGLKDLYGKDLETMEQAFGEHGKPFLKSEPGIHYNISHSGKYAVCVFAPEEVGIDVQEHRQVNYRRLLEKMVPDSMISQIMEYPHPEKAFYTQWVLREAYIKWTGQGLSQNLKEIPMDRGESMLLTLDEGYSGAVWTESPAEFEWVYKKIEL